MSTKAREVLLLLRMESDTIILTNQDFPERLHDMDVRIRKLQRTDFKAVAKIWREVLDIPVTDDELCETYEKMDGDDRYSTFVAEADGRVIGLVTMVTALAIGHPAGYSKVNGLGVLQEYRRNGIGKMLLKEAEQEAIANGTRYVGLASGFSREDAHQFYEMMGYQKTSYWYHKRLE